MRAVLCGALALMISSGCTGDAGTTEGETSSVVGGIAEPDANYPWVVHISGAGCGGVLIDPQWVLTAAHCVTPGIGIGDVAYRRTDPQTGAQSAERIAPNRYVGPANNRGVFIHPGYDPDNNWANDIALIKLATPFEIHPMMQTVGLPRVPRVVGLVGNLANYSHNAMLPPGYVAVFRAPMPADDFPPKFTVDSATAENGSLCPGDSGSGFVTVEDGRGTVRGVASTGSASSNCMTPSGVSDFTDVFTFREWILETMGKSDAALTGNTRVRWSGDPAHGRMEVSCQASRSRSGPLNVVGVEEGITCSAGQPQTVSCAVDANVGPGPIRPVLSGITMRTVMQDGTAIVRNHEASVNNTRLHTTFPSEAISIEYTCEIGTRRGQVGGVTPGGVTGVAPGTGPGTK
jgi:hypothetical protein